MDINRETLEDVVLSIMQNAVIEAARTASAEFTEAVPPTPDLLGRSGQNLAAAMLAHLAKSLDNLQKRSRDRSAPLPNVAMSGLLHLDDAPRKLSAAERRAFYRGVRSGLRLFAWWKEGVQYVGTTGTTLREALERVDDLENARTTEAN